MKRSVLVVAVAGLVVLGLQGCPPPGGWPEPPFDTTGTYEGTWSGRSSEPVPEDQQVIEACPLTLELTQDLTRVYPNDHAVNGVATIDPECITLPDWAQAIGITVPDEVNVTGVLTDDGKLTVTSGTCGVGLCLILTLAGDGADADEDGFMDTYAGALSYILLLPEEEPLGISGTFEVEIVAAE